MAGDTSGVLQLATNGSTTALTISTAQKVGIGTTSPSLKFHVVGPSDDYRTALFETASSNGPSVQIKGSRIYELRSTDTGASEGAGLFFIYDKTAEASRMTIDSGGALLLATTSTASFTQTGTLYIGDRGAVDPIQIYRNSTGASGQIGFNNPNGRVGEIYTSGSSTVYATSSDYRLKENIVPMTGALDTVQALKPVTYTWKVDGSAGQGFIAHELQEVVPDCVSETKDAVNEDGSIKAQGVDTSFLVATLTAAIQEQQTIINDLKARITALEGAA
jgi:hypothetical protein